MEVNSQIEIFYREYGGLFSVVNASPSNNYPVNISPAETSQRRYVLEIAVSSRLNG